MMLAALALMAGMNSVLAPHGAGVEDTYTLTTILKVIRPCRPAVMNDPYQDVKVLADNGRCLTLSITYFPLNDKVRKQRERLYATAPGDLTQYLRPTATCNWDPSMRAELIRDLKRDGIDVDRLKGAELVSRVASWAFRTSQFAPNTDAMPSDWFVSFDGGRPMVSAESRAGFDRSKTDASWTDQQVFEHQLLGREMLRTRSHGACTSSSIYLATILRALGVPTRILYFIPPCDANDPEQVKALSAAITRHHTRQTIHDGVVTATGFANHMYNEVWCDGRWQRLNYDKLGQEPVDRNYLGLMTHIDTCADISETHLAETWGVRSEQWPNVPDRLSSVNPYQLIAAADHWGKSASHDNPPVAALAQATIIGALWPATPEYRELLPDSFQAPKTDFVLLIKEWNPNRNYVQLREFMASADSHIVLRSPGHPDVHAHYNGLNLNNSVERGYAFCLDDADRSAFVAGTDYTIVPRNQGQNKWKVKPGLTIRKP